MHLRVTEVSEAEVDVGTHLLSSEAYRLRQAVLRLAVHHDMVTLKVGRVEVFDASGLGLLLGLHRLARRSGTALVVVDPSERLMAALMRRGLHRVLVLELPRAPESELT